MCTGVNEQFPGKTNKAAVTAAAAETRSVALRWRHWLRRGASQAALPIEPLADRTKGLNSGCGGACEETWRVPVRCTPRKLTNAGCRPTTECRRDCVVKTKGWLMVLASPSRECGHVGAVASDSVTVLSQWVYQITRLEPGLSQCTLRAKWCMTNTQWGMAHLFWLICSSPISKVLYIHIHIVHTYFRDE